MKNLSWICLTLMLGFVSCKDDKDEVKKRTLIGYTSVGIRSASELRFYASQSGIDIPVNSLVYDVQIYKVTYETQYKGASLNASGIVILPITTDAVGMISFHHGTITSQDDAPSNLPASDFELILYAALSSAGFIAVVPDYIGFGVSSQTPHPYYVEELTASAIIDNIKAGKELAEEKKNLFNNKLFLAGYSQGGYATMATHKWIEQNGLEGFTLTASFPASGGYDIEAFQEYFFALDNYDEPYYLGYVAHSYKTTYDWQTPYTDFFQEPYASRIPSLYTGQKSSSEINSQLTTSIDALVNPDLLANIDTKPAYKYIVDAFKENSLTDWTPTVTMVLYHGDADITVPYSNSQITYDNFISRGASPNVVSFITLPGAEHGSGVVPYIEDFVPRLLLLK